MTETMQVYVRENSRTLHYYQMMAASFLASNAMHLIACIATSVCCVQSELGMQVHCFAGNALALYKLAMPCKNIV